MTPDKPHAPATERNRDPILAVLRRHFAARRRDLKAARSNLRFVEDIAMPATNRCGVWEQSRAD